MTGWNRPQVPGFEIGDELGRGAYSVVYRASWGGVPCAIKLPSLRARWTRWIYREAVALARVRHPALPAVLEVGEVDDLPYLAMELVVGETLAAHIRARDLDEGTCLTLLSDLLDALAAVHDGGLVHRDVKPRNIILESGTEALRLVDFGFATPIERLGADDAAGTAAYAAPEQLVTPGRVDSRADLYAVGRVLIECLTGQLSEASGASLRAELLHKGVSTALTEIILGLVAHDATLRYPDAHAVKSELQRLIEGKPLLGPSAYTPDRNYPPIVARDTELSRVEEFLNPKPARSRTSVEEAPVGAIIAVRGSRGAGKTRLLGAIRGRVASLGAVVEVTCAQDDAPLATLRRVLELLATANTRESLGQLAAIAHLVAPKLIEEAPHRAGPSDEMGADTLAEGAAEIILRLAKNRPLYLIVDDVQWMDPTSADALLRLAHRPDALGVTFVIASRVEGGLLDRFRAARAARALSIDLAALTESQVGSIIASHIGEPQVEAGLVRRVHAMADGTVLGVLEVLRAYLDSGALRPHARTWRFDVERADRVVLPNGSISLVGRRLAELPLATQRMLEVAAVIGTSFTEHLLARTIGISVDDLGYGLVGARRSGLIEAVGPGLQRFVHDSLRERLIEGLDPARLRALHQRVAETLSLEAVVSVEELCTVARHYVHGELDANPAPALAACRAAANAALERFSNEVALELFEHVATLSARTGTTLDAKFHVSVGEALLRLGKLDESRSAFEAALRQARSTEERAIIHGRLAWVYQTQAEPGRASGALAAAFEALGLHMPAGTPRSAAHTAASVARAFSRRIRKDAAQDKARETELLSHLLYQNARLAGEYGEPLRLLETSVAAHELSRRGGSPRTVARAHALNGLVLSLMKIKEGGAREFDAAESTAAAADDPIAMVFCRQLRSVAALVAGEVDVGIELARECVDIYGPWLELTDFCLHILNVELIHSASGRPLDAWSWLERALKRLHRSNTRPVLSGLFIHRARATLAELDRQPPSEWLAAELAAVPLSNAGRGYHRLLSWGPRTRYYVERGDLGREFEEHCAAFRAEHPDPTALHLSASEHFVAVVQARMLQALRAPDAELARHMRALSAATRELGLVAKIPLLRAHHTLAEGCLASLEGKERRASRLLARAEEMANTQSSPSVLYGVAWVRAHSLRRAGKGDAARDQARIARTVALEHGAMNRARWVSEEFALPPVAADPQATVHIDTASGRRSSSRRRSSRTTRQLAALLHVAQVPRRDLRAEEQAARILDELIGAVGGVRGAIWFQPEPTTPPTAALRERGATTSISLQPESIQGEILRMVHRTGEPWPRVDVDGRVDAGVVDHKLDAERVVTLPLRLYDKPVGALFVERATADLPFEPDDRSLLELLSHQVPIALEMARLLIERERLHASLQRAKKMEAMGQLAGGIAHDFNNMLAAMKVSLNAAQERASPDTDLTSELEVIGDAMQRAAQLTGQLLSFSRHQPVPTGIHDVNQLILNLEPMLRRVAGAQVSVVVKTAANAGTVEVDQNSFDQALVNLLINSRDAMPKGGSFTITTKTVLLLGADAERAGLTPGEYVEIDITDTGEGMSPETLARIFEPFFTTKPVGRGTGLGLAMVYAFARNSGGAIDVTSELGGGTTFRVHLPQACSKTRSSQPMRLASSLPPSKRRREADTILVVDDDDLVRRSIAKILERNGYEVVATSSPAEAIDLARQHREKLALVILDVLMPGLSGPELGRKLGGLDLHAKMLFVSGFAPESVQIEEAAVSTDMLLQKPFSQAVLLERVRQLMSS